MGDTPDINDLVKTMVHSAEAAGVDGVPRERSSIEVRAEVGLQRLEEAVATAELAQNKAEAGSVVARLLAEPAALEAIALAWSRPAHWPSVEALMIRLRHLVAASESKSLDRAIKEAAERQATVRAAEPAPPRRPYNLGREFKGVLVPFGWQLDDKGVHIENATPHGISLHRVCSTPCLVSEVLVSLTDQTERVRLEWRGADGHWSERVIPRIEVRDAKRVVDLCNAGLDVGSPSARDLARWFADQENASKVNRSWVSERLGWQGEKGGHDLGFLWGKKLLGGNPKSVVTLDADEGAQQIADAYVTEGTLQGWRAAVNAVLEHPSAMLALYASLAAPFLALLPRAPNAIIDWSGSTSHGKTTVLALAASCWGVPEKGRHLVHSWDNSPTYLERAAEFTRHLPLIVDDTKDVRNPEVIERILYSFAGGSGRGRGSLDGMRRTAESRGVLLSSGEQPVTAFGSAAGARARVLTLRGRPFGDGDQRALVESLLDQLCQHHGHAGPRIVEHLASNRNTWDEIRSTWEQRSSEYGASAQGNNVLGRFGGVLALLECGAFALHDVLQVQKPEVDPFESAWRAALASSHDADRPAAAMSSVYSWAVANSADFYGRHTENPDHSPRRPTKGWAGKWDSTEWWTEICWVPEALIRVLAYQGFKNPEEVLASWQERGWLMMDGRNRGAHRRLDGLRLRLICIARETLEAVLGEVQ